MRDGFASNFRLRFVGVGSRRRSRRLFLLSLSGNCTLLPNSFFGIQSLFWGAFWASIFFNGTSNSPTSSSLWPSSSLSLSSSSLNSSLSVSFLLFHWSNGKTFDHTKLWWELIQTLRHNTFRRDIVAEICSLWARISWASSVGAVRGNIFWWNERHSDFGLVLGRSGFGFDFGRIFEINWDFLCRSSSRTVIEKENRRPSALCETSCV